MVNANSGKSDDQNINDKELARYKSDATSKETLEDLEEAEADIDSGGTKPDPGPIPGWRPR